MFGAWLKILAVNVSDFSPLFFRYSRTLQLCTAHSKKHAHAEGQLRILVLLVIYSFVRFSIYINPPLIHSGKSGLSNLGKATAATTAVLPIPISVCSITVCPNNGMAASVWDFSCAHTCGCIRLHKWSCINTGREYEIQQP